MASSCALRNELVSSILRGVTAFRRIELANQLAEDLALEARMAESTISPDGKSPSPREIRETCEAIQANWTDVDRDARLSRTTSAVTRWFSPEEAKAQRLERQRASVRRYLGRREAAGRPRYTYKRKVAASA